MSSPESADPAAPAPNADVDILDEVNRAIAVLESHSDPAVRGAAQALLTGIDAVHRAGLTHLVEAVHGMAGEAFLSRLTADPAIRLLLMSYNLIAVDRRLQAEEALDRVRGHLHDHGVDVEITEVVGGVVYVRLHLSHRARDGGPSLPAEAVRRNLEAALCEGLLGFQELVTRDRADPRLTAAAVPLTLRRSANRPVYVDAGAADLAPGSLRAAAINGAAILFAAVDADVYAVSNQCGDSPLPLEFSTLDGATLRCSWHGCLYDVRTGRRAGRDERLRVYPVSIEDGRIRVALDVESAAGDR